jgi:hypothetical protein
MRLQIVMDLMDKLTDAAMYQAARCLVDNSNYMSHQEPGGLVSPVGSKT